MVSLIQSNFPGMGSGIVIPGLGFAFIRVILFVSIRDYFCVLRAGKNCLTLPQRQG
jgi:hypothetical protein